MNPDRHIIQQIEGAFTRDSRVQPNPGTLAVQSEGGYVTLSGAVSSVAAKRLATSLVRSVPGVKNIADRIRVEAPNPMGDLEIAEHVRHAFIQERNIEEDHIDIETDAEGGVTLRGSVHSLVQLRLCEVLCWWIPGVTDVRNLLVVNPPEEDSDEELKDNLITIMEKDVLVNPKKFRVEVAGGRVTLRGRVDSETERDAAEKDCWYTPGVMEVDNRLTVG
jgi:osmotically-inducible protein OsmY